MLLLGDRFWSKVKQDGDCWTWAAGLTADGYASYKYERKTWTAHRLSWMECVGPLPDGLELDHLCRNRACVNPEHLDAVPHATNVSRGSGPTARFAQQSHCKRGHEFNEANTYVWRTSRICRTCRATHHRRQAA